ncbi:hypothetical protein D3C71_1792450 [compost metagenome]
MTSFILFPIFIPSVNVVRHKVRNITIEGSARKPAKPVTAGLSLNINTQTVVNAMTITGNNAEIKLFQVPGNCSSGRSSD